ncbi:hypothetical protein DMA11_08060 [Marinilabiliaceae bacterium JC017]|nr:hypothetical protein DMA11_08060 [Marinilabiliaceae bacterium JC017]
MNKGCQICWWVLGVFLIANIGFLGIWFSKNADELRGSRQDTETSIKKKNARHCKIMEKLDLDEGQKKAFVQEKSSFGKTIGALHQEMDSLKYELGGLIFSDFTDSVKPNELIDQIVSKQRAMELLSYQHFKTLRTICRPEQQAEFDKMFKKVMRRMRHHGHRAKSVKGNH